MEGEPELWLFQGEEAGIICERTWLPNVGRHARTAKYLGVGSPILAKPAGILMFRRNLNIRSMDLNCFNVAMIL